MDLNLAIQLGQFIFLIVGGVLALNRQLARHEERIDKKLEKMNDNFVLATGAMRQQLQNEDTKILDRLREVELFLRDQYVEKEAFNRLLEASTQTFRAELRRLEARIGE